MLLNLSRIHTKVFKLLKCVLFSRKCSSSILKRLFCTILSSILGENVEYQARNIQLLIGKYIFMNTILCVHIYVIHIFDVEL